MHAEDNQLSIPEKYGPEYWVAVEEIFWACAGLTSVVSEIDEKVRLGSSNPQIDQHFFRIVAICHDAVERAATQIRDELRDGQFLAASDYVTTLAEDLHEFMSPAAQRSVRENSTRPRSSPTFQAVRQFPR